MYFVHTDVSKKNLMSLYALNYRFKHLAIEGFTAEGNNSGDTSNF